MSKEIWQSIKPVTVKERLKYEIAEEIGLLPRVIQVGWAGLSPSESGRIGGKLRARIKQMKDQGMDAGV